MTPQEKPTDFATAEPTAETAAEPKSKVEVARDLLKEAQHAEAATNRRSAHVQALENELEYLTRQPKPNEARVAAVQEQLAEFSDKPTARKRETRTGA